MMFLVDTNVLSELMRQQPDEGVLAWAKSLDDSGGTLSLSVVTVDEIIFGLQRRPGLAKLAWFDQFLLGHQVFAIDTPIARRAADLRAFLSLQGEVRTQADMLIAATAQIHGLSLVTRNVRDFEGCGIPVLNPFRSKPF